jgi:hypothetical protein
MLLCPSQKCAKKTDGAKVADDAGAGMLGVIAGIGWAKDGNGPASAGRVWADDGNGPI